MTTRLLALVLSIGSVSSFAQANPQLRINGRRLTQQELKVVAWLEQTTGQKSVPGDYWYDNATGALGKWGGPTMTFLPPGLGLGGALPANASGGGMGQLTGVFINGRELHPVDVMNLTALLQTQVQRGRWWVDAQGNCGLEGGPPLFNLHAVARANAKSNDFIHKSYGKGESTYVGKGCAAVRRATSATRWRLARERRRQAQLQLLRGLRVKRFGLSSAQCSPPDEKSSARSQER
ncbi:MAG: hypothetical protein QM817_34745 [Archangium sp.]